MAPAPVKFTVLVPQVKLPVLVFVQLAPAVRVAFSRVRLPALVMLPEIEMLAGLVLVSEIVRLPLLFKLPLTVIGLVELPAMFRLHTSIVPTPCVGPVPRCPIKTAG